jgi:hypothetical protein
MAKPPPVPPQNRSPAGTGSDPKEKTSDLANAPDRPENLAEQDRQGNTKQNTTHQGDRQGRP